MYLDFGSVAATLVEGNNLLVTIAEFAIARGALRLERDSGQLLSLRKIVLPMPYTEGVVDTEACCHLGSD